VQGFCGCLFFYFNPDVSGSVQFALAAGFLDGKRFVFSFNGKRFDVSAGQAVNCKLFHVLLIIA
jgi:hypothetical protein